MRHLIFAAALLMAGPAAASYAECEAAQRTHNRLTRNASAQKVGAWWDASKAACPVKYNPPREREQWEIEIFGDIEESPSLSGETIECRMQWRKDNPVYSWGDGSIGSANLAQADAVAADMRRMGCR